MTRAFVVPIFYFLIFLGMHYFLAAPRGEGVFVPINAQNRTCGDFRYYFSGVKEAGEDFWTYSNSVREQLKEKQIDKSRWNLYRLGYLLTLGIKDSRWAFLTTYLLGILLTVGLLSCFYSLELRSVFWAGTLPILFMLFLMPFKSLLDLNWTAFKIHILDVTLNPQRSTFLEGLNDNFRFLVMSHGNIFFVFLLLIVAFLNRNKSWPMTCLLLVASGFVLSYSYGVRARIWSRSS